MKNLRLHNTLSKSTEPFRPMEEGRVSMYICGPTVYDSPHIGHARTYIAFDVIRRVLSEYFNYDVIYTMNITDIDDKIIRRAAEREIGCDELSAQYEDEFFCEMDRLGVRRPDFTTRVTNYVQECASFVERLEDMQLAYPVEDGSVYFDLQAYKRQHKYNLLRPQSQRTEEEASDASKRGPEDFVLWKASKENEPRYPSRWGPGRPGWHIECSVMSSSIFGPKLDIHAGGIDLAFPHHENEIAQCQGHSGESWVNYFLHTGHLNIEGLKMSKSLKNFLTIRDILSQSSPAALRILFLQHQWNKDMSYDPEQLKEAEAIKKRLFSFVSNCEALARKVDRRALETADRRVLDSLKAFNEAVDEHLCNNINTPRVLEEILGLISSLNVVMGSIHTDVLRVLVGDVLRILRIFGIAPGERAAGANEEGVAELLGKYRNDVRAAARKGEAAGKYFELSDGVREALRAYSYTIDDTAGGSIVRKI